jgi:hypothetical protein
MQHFEINDPDQCTINCGPDRWRAVWRVAIVLAVSCNAAALSVIALRLIP